MAVAATTHRWTLPEYLRAWEAGAFDGYRTELLDGEVLDVSIGRWHGATAMRVARALPNDRYEITSASLPSGQSLPDPDCWVLRPGGRPVEQLSPRMPRWAVEDVLLIVEVSDETEAYDLARKAVLYAESGYPAYWVVTSTGVYAHREPSSAGYLHRSLHPPGSTIAVPYAADVTLAVDDLLAPIG